MAIIVISQKKRTLKSGKSGSAGLGLLCLVGVAGVGHAQEVLTPTTSPVSTTPPAVQEQQAEASGTLPAINVTPPGLPNYLHWGPVEIHPHPTYQFLYGTGIQSAPGAQHNSIIQEFSPGVLMRIGTHWTIDYTPTLEYYSDSHFRDTVNHIASLNWGTAYEDWTLGFSQSYANTDTPLVETGTQTATQSYSTALSASYRFNTVLSLDSSISQSISEASQFSSSKSWNTLEWLNYQFWPRLNAAIGTGFGYDLVSLGPDMTHETLQGRITWRAGDKISLALHGGAEDRQYIGGGVPDTINPTYGASIQYEPFTTTLLSLSADRAITTSLFQNSAIDSTSLTVGLSQRLFERFQWAISGSYGSDSYITTSRVIGPTAALTAGRSDTRYVFLTKLTWQFLTRATASVTETYSVNRSDIPGFSYSSNQIGLELGYTF